MKEFILIEKPTRLLESDYEFKFECDNEEEVISTLEAREEYEGQTYILKKLIENSYEILVMKSIEEGEDSPIELIKAALYNGK